MVAQQCLWCMGQHQLGLGENKSCCVNCLGLFDPTLRNRSGGSISVTLFCASGCYSQYCFSPEPWLPRTESAEDLIITGSTVLVITTSIFCCFCSAQNLPICGRKVGRESSVQDCAENPGMSKGDLLFTPGIQRVVHEP